MPAIKRILVSGSSGTIGTALCERLLNEGFEVTGLDIKPNSWNSVVQSKTRIVDLRNPKELEKLPKQFDLFVHLAANAYVFPSVVDPKLAIDNTIMTLNCLEFCRVNKIPRFLFASSREIYGNTKNPLHSENDFALENTESPYAASKVASEAFVHAYQNCFGIDFQIFRFSNVYGKFDASDRLIPLVIRKNRANEPITVFGEKKELPFTYIDDAVQGIVSAIVQFEKTKNQSFNIAALTPTKIVDIVKILQKKMHSNSSIMIGEKRTGEVERFVADVSKAKKELGFEPRVGIEEGLEKTVEWYQQHMK